MEKQELQGICEDGPKESGVASQKETEIEDGQELKWKVWAEEEVAAPARRVWEVVSQFCRADVWSGLETCEKVEGEERVAGCVRLCKGSSDFSAGGLRCTAKGMATPAEAAGGGGKGVDVVAPDSDHKPEGCRAPPKNWSREKLLQLDDAGMVFSYEVVDSNLGLRGYYATFQVLAGASDFSAASALNTTTYCRLRWTAHLDPVPFASKDRLSQLLRQLFRRNVEKLRHIVCNPT